MKTKIKSILVVSILVLAGFIMLWNFGIEDVTVQGATIYVGPTSSFKSINSAIENSTAGNTIIVENGTYNESVLIDKANINLVGNSTTDCIIQHHFFGTNMLFDYAAGINVTASGVNITGFNISVTGDFCQGIRLTTSTSNSNIINNNISTNGNQAIGIFLHTSTNSNITDNYINTSGSDADGIYIYSTSTSNNITDNTIEMQGTADGINIMNNCDNNDIINNVINTFAGGCSAIYSTQNSNNDIFDNTINCQDFNYAMGIYLHTNNYKSNVINNTVTTKGDNGRGILIQTSSYIEVQYNTIKTAGDTAGIHLQPGTNINISHNTINTTGYDGFGIYLRDSTNCNLTDNIINTSGQNGYGIFQEISANDNDLINNTIITHGQNALGIYLATASNNNDLTDNTINTYGEDGYGIRVDTFNNNIINNEIRTYNQSARGISTMQTNNNLTDNSINTSGGNAIGIRLYQSYNCNIINNEINTSGMSGKGIEGWYSTNNNLINNTINTFEDQAVGIWLGMDSNNNNLTDNTITTYGSWAGLGIQIAVSLGNNVTNSTITTFGGSGQGIWISDTSTNNTISNATIKTIDSNAQGIRFENSDNNSAMNCNISTADPGSQGIYALNSIATIFDSQITATNGEDLRVFNDGNLTVINCSFNTVDSVNGVIQVKNYLTIQAYYDDATTPIQAADVLVEDNAASVYTSTGYGGTDSQTDSNGRVEELIVTDRWYFYSDTATENDTSVKVKKTVDAAWEEVRNNVDMNTTHIEVFIATDIIKPIIPVNLNATPVPGGDAINISWNVSLDDTVNYELWWIDPNTSQWVMIANISHPTNWFVWQNDSLVDGNEYTFKLRAWDDVNLTSDYTAEVDVTHQDYLEPAAPTNLQATALSETSIELDWDASIDADVVSYSVFMNQSGAGSGGPYMLLNTVTTLTYQCIMLLEYVTYYFVVLATDEAANPSLYSNEASNTTIAVPPNTPTLDALAQYTNNPSLGVTGTADNSTEILVYINDMFVTANTSSPTGIYDIEITLVEDENEIKVMARDQAMLISGFSNMETIILDVTAPSADAGVDINIMEGETANFNGTGSSDNWGITNFTWNFTYDSLPVKLYGEEPSFDFDMPGVYVITLTLTDVVDNIGTDTVTVTVSLFELPDTESPIADAGPDQTVEEGTEVTFDGSGSTDNNAIRSYTWTFTYEGNQVSLYNVTTTFVFDIAGSYNVTLIVADFAATPNIGTDNLWVNVTAKSIANDTDGDGYNDDVDAFPNDPAEWEDTDGDLIGDNADTDDDNDDYLDDWETTLGTDPKDATSTPTDTDDDGQPDGDSGNTQPWMDTDDDGDGYTDAEEIEKGTDPLDEEDYPTEKGTDGDADDYTMYIILIIIIIIIIAILAFALSRRKPTEEELLVAEEEEEIAEGMAGEEELDTDEGVEEEGEDEEEEEVETFECPTCGAEIAEDITACPECGEEFGDED